MQITNPKALVRLLCATIEDGDVAGVQELLENGCPVSHPDVRRSAVLLALEKGMLPIVDALMDAGAELPCDNMDAVVSFAIQHGSVRIFNHALQIDRIEKSDFDGLLYDAASKGVTALALRLLELGASPLYEEKGQTAFQRAVDRDRQEIVRAMVAALTQPEKDQLLLRHVLAGGNAACVRILLAAGADAAQRNDRGRTLLQLASSTDEGEAIKRLLRSVKTAESIDLAMSGDDGQPPAPANTPFAL